MTVAVAVTGMWRASAKGRMGDEAGAVELGVGIGGPAGELGRMGPEMGLSLCWLLRVGVAL